MAVLARVWRLVIGLTGGGVTGLAAGASRTATAYERMLEGSAPSDLLVLDPGLLNAADRIDLDDSGGDARGRDRGPAHGPVRLRR